MSKKFGKFLLFTAALSSIAAATYYYFQQKESVEALEEDDFDDFDDDDDEIPYTTKRSYVPLTPSKSEFVTEETEESSFTPLSETLRDSEEPAEETVEEFFDADSEE